MDDVAGGASFADEGIEKLLVALRDGRKLIGVLRSWDQFGRHNCVAI